MFHNLPVILPSLVDDSWLPKPKAVLTNKEIIVAEKEYQRKVRTLTITINIAVTVIIYKLEIYF